MLVDISSSANIIFLIALKEMGIKNIKIKNVQVSLVGFSGEPMSTVGTICLPIYTEGINLMVTFMIIDCPSSYNVILGRPWIYVVKVVPFTYHQVIRFPTKI